MQLNDRQKAILKAAYRKAEKFGENGYFIDFQTAKNAGGAGQTITALVRKGYLLPRQENSWFWHLSESGLIEREKLCTEQS